MNAHIRTSRNGFTLPELIVVISIALILLGSLAPALSSLRDTTQMQVAINTVGVAVTTARAYATVVNIDDLDGVDPEFRGLKYSGTAMLFTPAGELRLVQNNQLARDGNGNFYLQQLATGRRNGYADIPDRDYIKLPKDAGVVGIARNRTSLLGLLLLTPPFAVRFDQHGGLIAGQSSGNPQRVVYYDSNYNGRYTTSLGRTSAYNPDDWDPNSPSYSNRWVSSPVFKYALPFEEIETVVGVVIYSKHDLRQSITQGHVASSLPGNPINNSARDWILANGKVLLFSRYSGALIKQP